MKKRFILLQSHWDHSGPLQSFGPYDTEEEARAAEEFVDELVNSNGLGGRWDVIRCTDFSTTP